MARFLEIGLFREGPTDYSFLKPLLTRIVQQLCLAKSKEPVEIGDLLELKPPVKFKKRDRATQILEAARAAGGVIDILFIHADGDGDPEAARREQIEPGADLVSRELGEKASLIVAVIPVRETEAWALVDGNALRESFGTNFDDRRLNVPEKIPEVEKILDPKQALQSALSAGKPARRRRHLKYQKYLDKLGETVSLDLLEKVPAFQNLKRELSLTLIKARILDD